MESKIHEYVRAIPIDTILRIDIGLEGDWRGFNQQMALYRTG